MIRFIIGICWDGFFTVGMTYLLYSAYLKQDEWLFKISLCLMAIALASSLMLRRLTDAIKRLEEKE